MPTVYRAEYTQTHTIEIETTKTFSVNCGESCENQMDEVDKEWLRRHIRQQEGIEAVLRKYGEKLTGEGKARYLACVDEIREATDVLKGILDE